jgi:NAD(P)-dependent dehydrogenase (short-subunit alcohol dehydrogenase family)
MKTVIVTGGNRGIGFEICRQLDESGFQVILGSRNPDNGIKASKALSKNVIVKKLDVTNEDTIRALYDFVKSEIGKLDVLINNAGLGANSDRDSLVYGIKKGVQKNFYGIYQIVKKFNPLIKKSGISFQGEKAANIALTDVRRIMETNFYGAWHMMQVFIPLLLKSEDGRIINVSSGMGELKSLSGLYPGYSLSKSALNALTIMFSNELKEKGIKVNAMCPGWVKTDMGGPDAPRTASEGADTAVWLATEKVIPTGKFFRDRHEISW